MLYTFTGYLVLVTCIATNCTAVAKKANATTGRGQNALHLVNVTILSETKCAESCSSTMCKQCVQFISDSNLCEDGFQLSGRCSGQDELPCCCNRSNENSCQNCMKSIRCNCSVESKRCWTATTTPATTSDTASDTTTPATTSDTASDTTSAATTSDTASSTSDANSLTSTITASSAPTPGGTTTDPTASGTTTGGPDATPMGVFVGAVVGALFGGVVITVVIVFLCRACRSKRRHTENEDEAETNKSRTYLGLIPTTSPSPDTHAVTSNIPDVIKVSAVQQASSAPSDVYDVIKEGEDNQLGVDPSAGDQGDYVEIIDDMTEAAVYSLEQAAPGMALQDGTPQPTAELSYQ